MTNEGLSLLTFSPKITLEHKQKSSQCLFWPNRKANKALETAVKVASTQGCSTQAADGVAAKDDTGTSFSSHADMGYGQETDLEQLDRPPPISLYQEYFSLSQRQTISSLSTWIRDRVWMASTWLLPHQGRTVSTHLPTIPHPRRQ